MCPCPVLEQTHLLCKALTDAWKWKGIQTHPFWPNAIANEAHTQVFCHWGCFPTWMDSGCLLSIFILLTHDRDQKSRRSTLFYQLRFFLRLINKRTPSWLCLTSRVYGILMLPFFIFILKAKAGLWSCYCIASSSWADTTEANCSAAWCNHQEVYCMCGYRHFIFPPAR